MFSKKSFSTNQIKKSINKMQSPTILQGTLVEVGNFKSISRVGKSALNKRILGFKTEDGQLLFVEIRGKRLDMLIEPKPILVGDKIRIHLVFQGSIKGEMRYNNIFVKKIELL